MTPNDLWPPPKTIGIIYSIWAIYRPSMRSLGVSLLEISCTQDFQGLTPGDPRWPLTPTKNNRVLPLNMGHLCTKFENCQTFPSGDIVFTSKASHTHTHTYTHTHTHTHKHTHTYIHTHIHTHSHILAISPYLPSLSKHSLLVDLPGSRKPVMVITF